jgi:Flp pilus assembly protein TadD
MAFEGEGQLEAVLADAAKAIEMDPKLEPLVRRLRFSVAYKREDFTTALDEANKAVELQPDNPSAYRLRSAARNRLKLFAESAEDARKASELAPTDPFSRLNYAYALSRVGDFAGAQRELDEAEQTGHRSAWFYNNLAWLLATADDEHVRNGARAQQAIERAVELMPNEPGIWDTQAAV